MFPKISLTTITALLLMMTPQMACASQGTRRRPVRTLVRAQAPGVVVAQENQGDQNDNEADSDNESNDNADENQNGDANQNEQQNADNGNQVPQNFDAPGVQPGEAIRVPPLRGYTGQLNPNE